MIRVMTYNICMGEYDELFDETKFNARCALLQNEILSANADVICLQETRNMNRVYKIKYGATRIDCVINNNIIKFLDSFKEYNYVIERKYLCYEDSPAQTILWKKKFEAQETYRLFRCDTLLMGILLTYEGTDFYVFNTHVPMTDIKYKAYNSIRDAILSLYDVHKGRVILCGDFNFFPNDKDATRAIFLKEFREVDNLKTRNGFSFNCTFIGWDHDPNYIEPIETPEKCKSRPDAIFTLGFYNTGGILWTNSISRNPKKNPSDHLAIVCRLTFMF
jgi:exonuclease III